MNRHKAVFTPDRSKNRKEVTVTSPEITNHPQSKSEHDKCVKMSLTMFSRE